VFLRGTAAGIAAAGIVLANPASSAMAVARSSHVASGDAGYVVTGSRLGTVETWVTLPHASRFAHVLGRLGVTVQVWTSAIVLDLKADACTDTTCRPGGRPVSRDYRLEFSVYNRKTRALICSTSAAGRLRCPGVPRAWNTAKFAPGHAFMLAMVYTVPWDFVFASADVEDTSGGQAYNFPVMQNVPTKPTKDFSQARIGVELGASPWASVPMRAPKGAIKLASFDRPAPPPYAAEIVALSGRAGGIAAAWWGHHAIRATAESSARSAAKPGALWDDGYGFTVDLEPKP
jgi:hypothetical protein